METLNPDHLGEVIKKLAKIPENLVEILQKEVNNSVNCLKDKRLCVAGHKTKLLIIGYHKSLEVTSGQAILAKLLQKSLTLYYQK